MPRIPEFVPRVRPEVPQSPGYSAPGVAPVRDATGQQLAALGEGLQAAGVAADRIGDWIDEVQAQDTFNLFNEELAKIETTYGSLQGKEAMDAYSKTADTVAQTRKKFESSLQNERQRALFASRAGVQQADTSLRINTWGAKQTKVAKHGTLEAAAEGSFREYQRQLDAARAVPDGDNPAAAQALRKDLQDRADATFQAGIKHKEQAARLLGATDEQIAEMKFVEGNKVHTGVLDSLFKANRTSEAKQYLAQHEKELTPEVVNDARQQLRISDTRDTAWNLANSADLPPDFLGKIETVNGLRSAGKLNTEEWQETVKFAQQMEHLRRDGENGRKVDLLTEVEKHFSATPGLPLPTGLQSSLQTLGLMDEALARRDNARSTDAGRQKLLELSINGAVLRDKSWNDTVLTYGTFLSAADRDETLFKFWQAENGGVKRRGGAGTAGGASGGSEGVFTTESETLHFFRQWAGDAALRDTDSGGKAPLKWNEFDDFKAMWTLQLAERESRGEGRALTFKEKTELLAELKLRNKGLRGDDEVNYLNLTDETEQRRFQFSPTGARVNDVLSDVEAFNPHAVAPSMFTLEARQALKSHDARTKTGEKFGVYNAKGELDYEATGPLGFLRAVDWARAEKARETARVRVERDTRIIRSREAEARSLQQRDIAIRKLVDAGVQPGSHAWLFATGKGSLAYPGEDFDTTLERLVVSARPPARYDADKVPAEQRARAMSKDNAELVQRVEAEVARLTALAADDPSWQAELDDYKRGKAYERYLKIK